MPRIIQIIDCDSSGHKVRMNDGEFAFLPHDPGCVPCVGEDLTRDPDTGKWSLTPFRVDSGAESTPTGAVTPEQAPAPDSLDEPPATDPAPEA